MTDNEKAFLDMIAWSEIGAELLKKSDNGYNVIVGSTPSNPDLFTDYSEHPRKLVDLGNGLKSTAAGRYQILARYYSSYKRTLHLPDFSPDSQDRIAMQLIKECRAIELINNGHIIAAIIRCSSRWASFPGNTYQQHINDVGDLIRAYIAAGGKESSY
jgi:muramidase (phage lysozyme)